MKTHFVLFLKKTLSSNKFELSFIPPTNANLIGITINQNIVGAVIISSQTNGNSINTKSYIEKFRSQGFNGKILIKSVFQTDPTAHKLTEYGANEVVFATKIPERLNEIFA